MSRSKGATAPGRRRNGLAGSPAGPLVLAALLLAPLLAAACGGEGADGPPEARDGGTAVVGGLAEVPTVNPFFLNDYVASQMAREALFLTLVELDADLEPRPRLARSWSWSEDSTRVTFRLREDVRWHDGEPVDAEDVAFTFRTVRSPAVGAPGRLYFERWDSVRVVDEHTVRFRVDPGHAPLFGWTRVPVAPEHVLGDVPPAELSTHPFGTSELVGSGPFRLVEHRPGDRWVLAADSTFPEGLGGPPRLDRLVYRVVPDGTTLLAELRAGEVDFYMRVLPSHVDDVRSDTTLRLSTFPFPSYSFVAWNARRAPFDDVRVRRALTMAIDREEMVETVVEGLGTVASGPVGPWHPAHDEGWRPLPHAPDSARALLEAAGWRDRDGDGVRERDGRPLRFELSVPDVGLRRDLAVMIQAHLEEVGVAARPRTREYSALVSALTGEARDFDAALVSYQPDLAIDDRDLWSCGRPDAPLHLSGWCDEELDAVMDSAAAEPDRDRRIRLLRRYHETVHRAQPFTFLYFEERGDALRRGLRGVELDPRGELISVTDWWLEPGSR